MLIHLVDISGETGRAPVDDLNTLRRELELFRPELAAKPQLVAANKIDAMDPAADDGGMKKLAARAKALGLPFFKISAVTGAGVPALLEGAWRELAPKAPAHRDVSKPAKRAKLAKSARVATRAKRATATKRATSAKR